MIALGRRKIGEKNQNLSEDICLEFRLVLKIDRGNDNAMYLNKCIGKTKRPNTIKNFLFKNCDLIENRTLSLNMKIIFWLPLLTFNT